MNQGLYACMRAMLSWVHYEGLVSISVLDVSHTAVEKRESGMLWLWCHVISGNSGDYICLQVGKPTWTLSH